MKVRARLVSWTYECLAWKTRVIVDLPDLELEQRKNVYINSILSSIIVNFNTLLKLEKYSKLSVARRVTGWIFWYIHNLRNKHDKRRGPLTNEELFIAESHLIKEVQFERFPEEIKSLKFGQMILKDSKIYDLNPFLSNEGVLRLGGRLQKSSLSFQEEHPVIVPSKNHFINLLIRETHERVFYTGVPALLCSCVKNIG